MVKRCKVENCGSSGKEKNTSIFAVPKDAIERKKWCEILNSNLNEVSYVCEKHFSPRHIRDSFTAQIPNGEVIFTRQYKRKILNKGALPKRKLDHSFQIEGTDKVLNLHTDNEIEVPNITYNSIGNCKKEITIEKGINDNSENEQLDTITYNVYDSNFIDSSTISNISDIKNLFGEESTIHNNELILPEVKTELEKNDISSSSAHHQSTNNTCEDLYLNLIQQILSNGLLVNLPNENWGIHKSIANKSIIFTYAEMISSPDQENILIPICLKRIGFGPTIEVYFHTKNIKLTSISKPKTVEELEHILLKIDTYKICSGGPSIKYYKNAHLECAVRDDLCWRHKECPIILDKGLICTHCVNLHTLLARCIHNQNRNYTKIRLLGSPNTKKKVAIIRAKSNIRLKKLCRKERVLERITEQLNQSVLKITQLERNKLVDEIDKLNLPHNQV